MGKLRIALVSALSILVFVTAFSTDSLAYVSVKGYFRSDGTYVRPYVRSNPNALKFDNYSWTPSQGLYNTSYYAPTKNYSSDWYTPSYITDPDYNVGKSLYESGQSGLSLYAIPKTTMPSYTPNYSGSGAVGGNTGISVPVVPTVSKVTTACGVNEYLSTYSNICYCSSGYKRNSSGICEKVICGQNEYLSTYNDTCYCSSGYKRNLNGICDKVLCGENEYISTYNNTCYCNSGYKRNSAGICEKVICGQNEYLSAYNSTCYCNSGYKKNNQGVCEQVICGDNEYLSTYNSECYCNSGYKRNYNTGKCEKVICGLNEYLSTWNNECYCNSGYKKNYSTGQCEQIILPANAHLNSWSSQGWYCDMGYKQVGNSCQLE